MTGFDPLPPVRNFLGRSALQRRSLRSYSNAVTQCSGPARRLLPMQVTVGVAQYLHCSVCRSGTHRTSTQS